MDLVFGPQTSFSLILFDDVCGIAGWKCVTKGTIYEKVSSKKQTLSNVYFWENIQFLLLFH